MYRFQTEEYNKISFPTEEEPTWVNYVNQVSNSKTILSDIICIMN